MESVPGAFTSRSKMRTRRARQRVVRAAEAEPEQAGGEASDASATRASSSSAPSTASIAAAITAPTRASSSSSPSTLSTAAAITAPAVHVPPFQPAYIHSPLTSGFGAEDRNDGYGSAPGDWRHADYYGFRSGPFVFAQDDFAPVEPNQAAKDPLNGAMIRRLFGDRWYGAQVVSIHEQLSTGDWLYTVRHQDDTAEFLLEHQVRQGVQDLQGPPPPHADPGMFESDVESENIDDDDFFLEGIEEEPSKNTSKLEKYLAAAQKEALRLRSGLEPWTVPGVAVSATDLTDGKGQVEQLCYNRLNVLAETLNRDIVSLKPFQTCLWLGTV